MLGGLAADIPPAGANDALLTVVGGIVVAAIGALGLVVAEWLRGRNARTTSSPPPPTPQPAAGGKDVELYERTAVLSRRADDNDERDDLQDLRHERSEDRLERLEQWAGHRDPDWWADGHPR